MKKLLNLIFISLVSAALAGYPFLASFCQQGAGCVINGGICKENPSDEPKKCCEGLDGEEYECKELAAGYFTCEKKKEEPK